MVLKKILVNGDSSKAFSLLVMMVRKMVARRKKMVMMVVMMMVRKMVARRRKMVMMVVVMVRGGWMLVVGQ